MFAESNLAYVPKLKENLKVILSWVWKRNAALSRVLQSRFRKHKYVSLGRGGRSSGVQIL